MPDDDRLLVGIDLGTTHTVVAWADPCERAEPRIFEVPQLVTTGEIEPRPLLPSFLYAPLPGEVGADPWSDAPWVVGELARRRGAEVPGRLVASAKSWLSYPAVDRTAPILPWGLAEDETDVPRVSPVDASARYLLHLRAAWDAAFPSRPLAEQTIVLTVPASFDEVARELTVEAATRAGLAVRLLEEPQAAFYDYLQRTQEAGLAPLLRESGGEALVLVCDVGGGTTDLSLLRAALDEHGAPSVARVAVGSHLLLGGDNMDLALAHLVEPRLGAGEKLDAKRFGQLVVACRAAKERLLGDDPPDHAVVTLLGSGSRLVGGSLSARVERSDVERIVLDGFFPLAPRDAVPKRGRGALVAFGLPYEPDVAMTRHVASFFARHAPADRAPHALLLNGGVFRAPRIATRLADAIGAWGGPPLRVLDYGDPDLAVARGAVAYALALRGRGLRIGGGAARGYYVGLDAPPGAPRPAVCIVPRGAEEGARQIAEGRVFSLTVGRPVRFDLFASDERAGDAPGAIVTLDDDAFQRLPPLATTLRAEGGKKKTAREVRVQLEGELTAVGTLDLACVELEPSARRHRLAFQLREPTATSEPPPAAAPTRAPPAPAPGAGPQGRRLDDAREAILRAFGPTKQEVEPREAKNLLRELERLLGERPSWTLETARALFDVLGPNARARRRSADHERMFWLLAGYCLRPGFGDPLDPPRVALVAPALVERLAFPDDARVWQQLWIAARRVAAGLDEATQTKLRDLVDPFLAPPEAKLKKPKGYRPEAPADLLDMASSLERVPPIRRGELGGWLLERTWTESDPRLWTAIGRLGARVPAYASVHHVVAPRTAERWIDHLLREKWDRLPTAVPTAVELARMTGDRGRDVSEPVRREVERKLERSGATEAQLRAVREVVAATEADRAGFYGESLPVGLRLLD